jgi:hypothetical protein
LSKKVKAAIARKATKVLARHFLKRRLIDKKMITLMSKKPDSFFDPHLYVTITPQRWNRLTERVQDSVMSGERIAGFTELGFKIGPLKPELVRIARCSLCFGLDLGSYRATSLLDPLPAWPKAYTPHHNHWCRCGTPGRAIGTDSELGEVMGDLAASLGKAFVGQSLVDVAEPRIAEWCRNSRFDKLAQLRLRFFLSRGQSRSANELTSLPLCFDYPTDREVKAWFVDCN